MRVTAGTNSVTAYFLLVSGTNGQESTGLSGTGLTLGYVRDRSEPVINAGNNLAANTTAFNAWGVKEVQATNMPGLYRADFPDAAFAVGSDKVQLTIYTSDIQPSVIECKLHVPEHVIVGTNLDKTGYSLAASQFVNIAGTNLDAIADKVWDESQGDHTTGGSFGEIATEIANILVDTAEIGAAGAGLTDLGGMSTAMKLEVNAEASNVLVNYDPPTHTELISEINDVQTDIAALNDPTAAAIADAVWDEDIVAAHTTGDTAGNILSDLTRKGIDFTNDVHTNSVFGWLMQTDDEGFDRATDSLEAIRDRGDAAWQAATTFVNLQATNIDTVVDKVWDELQSAHVIAGSFGEIATEIADILVDTAEIGAAGAGLTDLGGMSTAMKLEVNTEASNVLANYDPPTHAELVSEINDVQSDIAALSIPTAAAVADAVWDEDIVAAHSTGDTAGNILSDLTRKGIDFTNDVHTNSVFGWLMQTEDEGFDRATDSLEAIRDRGDAAWTTGGGGSFVNLQATNMDALVDKVWEEAQADHVAAGSFGVIATEIADILVDTAEIGAAGAGLTDLGGMSTAMKLEVNTEASNVLVNYDPATHTELISEINDVQSDIAALSIPTAAAVADAVWDEDIVAAHGTGDTAGNILSDLTRKGIDFTNDVHTNSVFGWLMESADGGYDRDTDSLETIRDRGDSAWITASGFSTFDPASANVTVGTNNDKTGYALTAAERNEIATNLVNTASFGADGYPIKSHLQGYGAALLGKVSGGPGGPVFRDISDSTNRITAVADADGDRTSITLNLGDDV